MSAPRLSRRVSRQLVAVNSTYSTGLTLPWTLIYGESSIRTLLELRAVTGNFGARVGFRTADVRVDVPDTWSTLEGTVRSTNGHFVQDLDLSAFTGKLWVQFRVAAGLTAGTAAAEAWARCRIVTRRNAVLLATRAIEVEPTINSAEHAYVPIGGVSGALGAAGLMFAFAYSGAAGAITYGPAYRTFDVNNLNPSAWIDLATYANITNDELRNSGDRAIAPGIKGFIQPAVKIHGTGARGNLRVLVAARYS